MLQRHISIDHRIKRWDKIDFIVVSTQYKLSFLSVMWVCSEGHGWYLNMNVRECTHNIPFNYLNDSIVNKMHVSFFSKTFV